MDKEFILILYEYPLTLPTGRRAAGRRKEPQKKRECCCKPALENMLL